MKKVLMSILAIIIISIPFAFWYMSLYQTYLVHGDLSQFYNVLAWISLVHLIIGGMSVFILTSFENIA